MPAMVQIMVWCQTIMWTNDGIVYSYTQLSRYIQGIQNIRKQIELCKKKLLVFIFLMFVFDI